jgi:type IV secretion system protein VirB4
MMLGGTHCDLGGQLTYGFLPLGNIDESDEERRWAQQWIERLCVSQQLAPTAEEKDAIWTALGQLAAFPREMRRLSTFRHMLQVRRLWPAFKLFLDGGPYSFFDATDDSFNLDDWTCFEMGHLMNLPEAVPHALAYMFHRMETRFTGRPTLIVLDEVRKLLAHHQFCLEIMDWLKEKAKKRVSVVLATQEFIDIVNTPAWPAIQNNCRTWIFLPNRKALEEDMYAAYRKCDLTPTLIQQIAVAQEKCDYLYRSEAGVRMYQLRLSPIERLLCAASRPEEIAAIQALAQQELSEPLAAAWLRQNGYGAEADVYNEEYAARRHESTLVTA